MSFFTEEYLKFFEGLAENNHKEWFDANRGRYETAVKKPFNAFVEAVIGRVQHLEPDMHLTPKDAVFRINRDVRFSKDKAPYKTQMSAFLAAGGKKSPLPGYYFELAANGIRFGGGLYMLEKEALYRVRQEIAYHPDEFSSLLAAKDFVEKFGSLQGTANKTVPAEFKDTFARQPLIANKQFYYMAELPPGKLLAANLPDIIYQYAAAASPMNHFLRRALED